MKYSKELADIEAIKQTACISDKYKEEDIPSFRWTFSDINDPRNFLPRALLTEGVLKEQTMKQCKGWGLSFFVSEEKAIKELNRYCFDKKFLYKKLGTHISSGQINKTDGLNGELNADSGHFTHYEYKDTDFSKTFIVKTEVYK